MKRAFHVIFNVAMILLDNISKKWRQGIDKPRCDAKEFVHLFEIGVAHENNVVFPFTSCSWIRMKTGRICCQGKVAYPVSAIGHGADVAFIRNEIEPGGRRAEFFC
jgi:hypothetical protein